MTPVFHTLHLILPDKKTASYPTRKNGSIPAVNLEPYSSTY